MARSSATRFPRDNPLNNLVAVSSPTPLPIKARTASCPCVRISSAFFCILARSLGSSLATQPVSIDSILSGAQARIVPLHFAQGSMRSSIRPTLLRIFSLQFRQISTVRSASRRVSSLSRSCASDHAGSSRSRSDFGDRPSGPLGVCKIFTSSIALHQTLHIDSTWVCCLL